MKSPKYMLALVLGLICGPLGIHGLQCLHCGIVGKSLSGPCADGKKEGDGVQNQPASGETCSIDYYDRKQENGERDLSLNRESQLESKTIKGPCKKYEENRGDWFVRCFCKTDLCNNTPLSELQKVMAGSSKRFQEIFMLVFGLPFLLLLKSPI